MPIISKDNLIKFGDNLFKVLKYRFADKSKSNVMQGEVIAKDFKSKSKTHTQRYKYNDNPVPVGTSSIFGKPSAVVTANTLVSRICVETIGYNVGDIVDKVNVFAVKNDNTVKELVVTDGTAIVIDHDGSYFNTNCKLLEIEIQKMFDEDVYFVVGCGKSGNGGQAGHQTTDSRIAMDIPVDGLAVGAQLSPITTYGRINSMIIYGEDNVVTGGVREWGDLEYTTEIKQDYTFVNLFADDPKWTGKVFLSNGNQQANSQYRARAFGVQYGKTYRFMNIRGESNNTVDSIAGSATCVEFNTNNNTFNSTTRVASGQWRVGVDKVCGRSYLEYTPTNASVTHISINLQYTVLTDVENEIMVWDSSVTPHKPYIPGTQSFTKSAIVDGDKVKIEFSNGGTSLQSNTLVDAVKELDRKIITTSTGVTRSVNSQNPNQQGSVTIDGTHINANVGGSDATIQTHLTNIKTTLDSTATTVNSHASKIARLESKHPVAKAGDIISTFQDSGDEYRVGGITYLYIGRERTLLDGYYPQLEQALGLSGVVNYQIPVIRDEEFIFDHGQRRRARKYYIVANVDNLKKEVL